MSGEIAVCIGSILLLFLIEGLFYGFDETQDHISDQELEGLGQTPQADFLKRVMENPERYIGAKHLWICGCAVLAGASISSVILSEEWKIARAAVYLIAVTVVLLLAEVFGSLIPRKLAEVDPTKPVKKWGGLIHVLAIIVLPFRWVSYHIAKLCLQIVGVDITKDYSAVTEDEIVSMVNEGHEQGVLEASEAEMINNIITFGDKEASDIMIHRANIVALDGKTPLGEALDWVLGENNSRFPVYEKNIDQVIGILYLRDIVSYPEQEKYADCPIEKVPGLLRKAYFIPETRNVSPLFREMQKNQVHIVIVVDEYGQTAGLLTMEDILEEIVGNIMDEFDEEEETLHPQKDGSYLIDGMAPFGETAEKLGLQVSEGDDYETLNGYLTAQLGRIPSEGEQPEVISGGYDFNILRVENRRISLVRAKKFSCDTEEKVLN